MISYVYIRCVCAEHIRRCGAFLLDPGRIPDPGTGDVGDQAAGSRVLYCSSIADSIPSLGIAI